MECELAEIVETGHIHAVVGTIVNVAAEEDVIGENGKVDPAKAAVFDNFQAGYYAMGDKIAQAWDAGKKLMK